MDVESEVKAEEEEESEVKVVTMKEAEVKAGLTISELEDMEHTLLMVKIV